MAKKNWHYAHASSQQVGTMVCIKCQQLIDCGQFKWYENFKQDAYLSMHRSCSEEDPKWGILDAEGEKNILDWRRRLEAYKAFRDQWNESALNEEIEDMERSLESCHSVGDADWRD